MTSSELVDQKPAARHAIVRGTEDGGVAGRRSGPAAAVVLAAGIACFALGLLSILAEASGSVSDALTLSEGVGPVSGLSSATTATFFVAWGALAIVWRRADPSLARVAAASAALVGLGLLGTFPPIFNAVGG
jgi:hypothetical protein